nr:DNA adenine methylase [uncultured Acetatifactor sp.]
MKAIAKYPGSKWSLASWIISFFPEHHSYLEPFFGSGAILFNKPRSHIETVNDLDGNVVNLFEWIKKDPERLAHEIYWTPYARQVYDDAFAGMPEDSLGRAVNFYIRLNMGHGFRTTGEKVGWKNDVQGRERSYASQDWCNLPGKIMQATERLRGVQIENRPAVDIIKRFNFRNVLIYCDPPYMLETRHGKQYRCEMDEAGHEELLAALLRHKGPVLISGYDTELYQDMLCEWKCRENTSYSQVYSMKKEMLWMNFEPVGMQMMIEDWRQMVDAEQGG